MKGVLMTRALLAKTLPDLKFNDRHNYEEKNIYLNLYSLNTF